MANTEQIEQILQAISVERVVELHEAAGHIGRVVGLELSGFCLRAEELSEADRARYRVIAQHLADAHGVIDAILRDISQAAGLVVETATDTEGKPAFAQVPQTPRPLSQRDQEIPPGAIGDVRREFGRLLYGKLPHPDAYEAEVKGRDPELPLIQVEFISHNVITIDGQQWDLSEHEVPVIGAGLLLRGSFHPSTSFHALGFGYNLESAERNRAFQTAVRTLIERMDPPIMVAQGATRGRRYMISNQVVVRDKRRPGSVPDANYAVYRQLLRYEIESD